MSEENIIADQGQSKERKVELFTGSAAGVLLRDLEASCASGFSDYLCRQIAEDSGWFLNRIHTGYLIDLEACGCQIRIDGCAVAESRFVPNLYLAVIPDTTEKPLIGVDAGQIIENACCMWIDQKYLFKAVKGGKIVNPANALFSWARRVLSRRLHEIFGFEDLQWLIDRAARLYPETVSEALKKTTKPLLLKVFRNLLEEGVSLQPLENIFCGIALHAYQDCSDEDLTGKIRRHIFRHICVRLTDGYGCLRVVTISAELEKKLLRQNLAGYSVGKNSICEELIALIADFLHQNRPFGQCQVLLADDSLRVHLSRILRARIAGLHVISRSEIPAEMYVETVGTVQ